METAVIYTQESTVTLLPIDQIRPNPYQPRKVFDKKALEELADSIKEFGVIQPVSVRKTGDCYELIAGERRLRASKIAGLEKIPVVICSVSDRDSAFIAILENLQRENLNFIEEAQGYLSLIRNYGLKQEEIALRLGKSQSSIANKIRLLRLSDEVKALLLENGLTERHARAILKITDEQLQLKVLRAVIDNKLNVLMTEKYVEKELLKAQEPKKNDPAKNRKFYIKDSRIYINTVKKAVELITQSGGDASYTVSQTDNAIEIIVTIVRPSKKC